MSPDQPLTKELLDYKRVRWDEIRVLEWNLMKWTLSRTKHRSFMIHNESLFINRGFSHPFMYWFTPLPPNLNKGGDTKIKYCFVGVVTTMSCTSGLSGSREKTGPIHYPYTYISTHITPIPKKTMTRFTILWSQVKSYRQKPYRCITSPSNVNLFHVNLRVDCTNPLPRMSKSVASVDSYRGHDTRQLEPLPRNGDQVPQISTGLSIFRRHRSKVEKKTRCGKREHENKEKDHDCRGGGQTRPRHTSRTERYEERMGDFGVHH